MYLCNYAYPKPKLALGSRFFLTSVATAGLSSGRNGNYDNEQLADALLDSEPALQYALTVPAFWGIVILEIFKKLDC